MQTHSPSLDLRSALVQGNRGSLYHFGLDFFLVGGGSFLFLLILVLFFPDLSPSAAMAVFVFNLTYVVNDPHFASSYVLLYRELPRMVFGPDIRWLARLRYVWAGVVAPLLLVGFCAVCFLSGDVFWLAQIVNMMYFFVGWHYIKQGYGVLITFSVLNRYFFSETEKLILQFNLYMVWAVAWLMSNQAMQATDFEGLRVYNLSNDLGLSSMHLYIAFGAMLASTLFTVGMFVAKYLRDRRVPSINGLVGYVMSSYGWLLAVHFHPFFLLFTPFFHSLQYLSLVTRYESNRTQASFVNFKGLLRFVLIALVLGYALFHGIPQVLQDALHYDEDIFGTRIFFFMVIIFINIHHYFIDNVIWRKDNESVRTHLFGR